VRDLRSYWAEHPPLHILVAGVFGGAKEQRNRVTGSLPPGSAADEPDEGKAAEQVTRLIAQFNQR